MAITKHDFGALWNKIPFGTSAFSKLVPDRGYRVDWTIARIVEGIESMPAAAEPLLRDQMKNGTPEQFGWALAILARMHAEKLLPELERACLLARKLDSYRGRPMFPDVCYAAVLLGESGEQAIERQVKFSSTLSSCCKSHFERATRCGVREVQARQ